MMFERWLLILWVFGFRLVFYPLLLTAIIYFFDKHIPVGQLWIMVVGAFLVFEGFRRQYDRAVAWADRNKKEDDEETD